MKRGVLLFALLLVIPFVSADMVLTQPDSFYNRGDSFSLGITIVSNVDAQDFLTVLLACPDHAVEIYRNPIKALAGQEKKVQVDSTFDTFLIGNSTGTCSLRAGFNGQEVTTNQFEISDQIDVNAVIPASKLNPGSVFNLAGNAIKKNGKNVDGFLSLSVSDLNFNALGSVNAGKFNTTILIPDNAKSGKHSVQILVYEKDSSGNILNSGNFNGEIDIAQVVKKVGLALNAVQFVPGDEVIYTPIVYDQAGDHVATSANVKMVNADGKVISEGLVQGDSAQSIILAGNATPGTWTLTASLNDYSASNSFTVDSVMKADFILENSTLLVTNTGNVEYSNPIEVKIGDTSESVQVDLGIGESKRYKLGAPDGNYEISVKENENVATLGSTFLTGDAVSVSEGNAFSSSITWIWLIILVVLGIAVVYYYNKISKKDSFSQHSIEYGAVPMKSSNIGGSDLIQQGDKQKATVIAVNVKNFEQLKGKDSSARNALKGLIDMAKSKKVHVVQSNEAILFVYNQLLTKQADNSMSAVQFANTIKNEIDNHNSRFAQKIQYGIGVHEGEIIAELRQDQFKFHALGNAITFAKKMAEKAVECVLISNPIHSLTRARVKVERYQDAYWKVTSMSDGSKHNKFIERFKERNS